MRALYAARRFAVPSSLAHLTALALGTAALVAIHASALRSWAYADWVAASAEARQALALAGPWAASCAAWSTSMTAARRGLICPDFALRSGLPIVAAHLSRLLLAAFLGLIAGLSPTFLAASLHAQSGRADAIVVLTGLGALSAYVTTGAALGYLVPRIVAAPTAGAVGMIASALSGLNGRPTAPIWPFDVDIAYVESIPVGVFRILYFTAWSYSCAIVVTQWFRVRGSLPTGLGTVTALSALVPVIVLGYVSDTRAPSLIRSQTSTPVCEQPTSVTVCVHRARRSLLRPLASLESRVEAAAGSLPPPYVRVDDSALWPEDQPGHLALNLALEETAHWQNVAALDLARAVVGAQTCATSNDESGATAGDPLAVADAIAGWIAVRAGATVAATALSPEANDLASHLLDLPDPVVKEAIADEVGSIRRCDADPSHLP